jgi:peroxiredoxin family protein
MMKKVAIVVFSGSVDRLTGMAVLASAAAASDMEVHILY